MSAEPGRRVRVTHPRTEAARRRPTRPTLREIDELTGVGEVYIGSLIRSQRRLAGAVCAAAGLLLGGLALLGALVPAYGRARIGGVSVAWLVLGVLVYPVLIALAALFRRQAERNENDLLALVRARGDATGDGPATATATGPVGGAP